MSPESSPVGSVERFDVNPVGSPEGKPVPTERPDVRPVGTGTTDMVDVAGMGMGSFGEMNEAKPVGSDDVGNTGSDEVGNAGNEVGSDDVGNAANAEVGRAGSEEVGNAGTDTLIDGMVAIGMIGGSWRTSRGMFRA